MFVDRRAELDFLTSLLTRQKPGPGQLFMLYGRRRVGKTALLRHWAEQSGLPFTYWVADKEPAPLQRRKLFARLLGANPLGPAPAFESWSDLWQAAMRVLGTQRHILILDELPYAAESDSAMLSSLQHAWDQHFERSNTVIALCGSQVKAMETLLTHQSPLFGRMTGQWHLQPLAFGTLTAFLPRWTQEELVAAYAIVGGVPAYLSWFDPDRSLVDNLRHVLLRPGSLVMAEATFLLADELREPRVYLAILEAIGSGHHTLTDIANASLVSTSKLSSYLVQLQDLRLVERRLPATIPPARQRIARQGRYHLCDPFLRFYFRFLHPYQSELSYQPERVLPVIQHGLRAFVGQTAWEELARQWVRQQGYAGALPFVPEAVGSHWSRRVQVDVVAINWQQKQVLLGECKWSEEPIDRQIVRELIEQKMPRLLADLPDQGQGWRVHYACFARAGFTPAARETGRQHGALLIDLGQLSADLAE
jgi:uncharacterized protein